MSEKNDYYSGIVDGGTSAEELKNAASGSNTSQKSKIVIENVNIIIILMMKMIINVQPQRIVHLLIYFLL